MSGVESSDRWNERQEQDVKLIQCIRDNPLVALGKPRDILAILREGSDPREYPNWHGICRAAADEIERLRAERDDARRSVCVGALPSDFRGWTPDQVDAALNLIASQQGWDCYQTGNRRPLARTTDTSGDSRAQKEHHNDGD